MFFRMLRLLNPRPSWKKLRHPLPLRLLNLHLLRRPRLRLRSLRLKLRHPLRPFPET